MLKVRRSAEVPNREDRGERRLYHLFDEVEIIITHVPPGHTQPFHRHQEISELYYVVEGAVEAFEGDDSWVIERGDSFLVTPDAKFHTVSNHTKGYAVMATIKLKPSNDSCPELFGRDKELRDGNE
jgi:uncharacterized cupin superfamily protein